MKLGAIGIGAQKCASSWVHAVAGTHPEIGVSDPKEVDFFSYYFDRGYDWYDDHFRDGPRTRIRFECSPSYFHDPRSPARARAYNPDLKVLAILRDPVKRAFSNHMHEIVKGHIAPMTFEEGLANNPAYVEQGLYGTHIGAWLDAFDSGRVKVMFAEEIGASAEAAAVEVFDFFGVDPTFKSAILTERRNESDRARFPVLRSGLRAGGDWLRRRGLESALVRVKATPPISQVMRANSIQIRDEIPPMRPETEARLRDTFAPEMARLRALLGREELPWERRSAAAAE